MIKPEQIYAATDGGLRILEIHIPNAREAARSKKAVKLREESTASAYIKLKNALTAQRSTALLTSATTAK